MPRSRLVFDRLKNLLLSEIDAVIPLKQKIDDVLAWKLDLVQSGGQHWHLFINSRGGGLVRAELLDEDSQVEYAILQSDFRDTSGFRYPHRIKYVDGAGQSLAVEVIDEIVVEEQAFDLASEKIAH